MKKEYVCKVDGQTFLTLDEAKNYLIKQYLHVKKIDDTKGIKEKIKTYFPTYIVEVSKDPSLLQNGRIDFDVIDFDAEKTMYIMMTDPLTKTVFCFAVSSNYGEDLNDELSVYKTIDDAMMALGRFMEEAGQFSFHLASYAKAHELLIEEINLGEIEEISCEEEHYFHIEYRAKMKDGSKKHYATVSINNEEMKDKERMKEAFEKELHRISGRYVTEVRGIPQKVELHDYYGNVEYEINGIRVNDLAKRAKKMRIRIIK